MDVLGPFRPSIYIYVSKIQKILVLVVYSTILSGCSMVAQISSSLFAVPRPIEVGSSPVANQDNISSVPVTGSCLPGVTSFKITSPGPEQTVLCNNGSWNADVDLSGEAEGPIEIVTDQRDPNSGNPIKFDVVKDTTPPTVTSLILDQGVLFSKKSILPYSVQGDDIQDVYVTEDIACTSGGTWQSRIATVPASASEGLKTFYVKARDAAGNISDCTTYSTITIDQTAPVITGLSDDLIIKANKSWAWSCTELNGGCEYRFLISQSNTAIPSGVFNTTSNASQTSGDGIYYLSVVARDTAGNESAVTRVQVNLSTSLPSLVIANGAAYTASNAVQLQLSNFSYFDEVELSNTAACASATTQAADSTLNWNLSAGDGSKTLYYRFKNSSTSEVTSCYDAAVIVDSTAPVVNGLSNDATIRTSKIWSWSCTDETPCSYRYVIDTNATTSPSGAYGSATSAAQSSGDGTYYIHVQARDALGNESTVVHAQVVLDNSAPTLSGLANDLTPQQSKTWTWTCSDAQACQTRFVIDQTATTSPTGAYSSTSTATQNTGDGNYYLHIQARDGSGNEGTVQHFRAILDNTAPVITGIANDATVLKSKTFTWSCTDLHGPCTYRYVVDSSATTTPTGAYSSATTMTESTGTGTFYLHLQARDVAGNESLSHVSFILDNTSPTVTLTSTAPATTNNAAIPVTATFSENVTQFTSADITVTNGIVSSFTGSGSSYTFDVLATTDGTVTISIAADVAEDAVGNKNTASNTLSKVYDSIQPTVTLSTTASTVTNISPIAMTATFSESVVGFIATDINIANGTISGFTGGPSVYTFNVTPSAQGDVSVGISAGVTADAAGNYNSAAVNLVRTYDNIAPSSPTIAINAGADYTSSTSVALSLSALGDPSEIYVTNTAGCASGGTWATYATTSAWTLGQTNGPATVYVKYRDAALNESTCVNDTIIHDSVAPTAVTAVTTGTYFNSTTSTPTISYGATTETASGLSHYEIALGTTSGGTDTSTWTSVGTSLSTTRSSLTLSHGVRYYPSVRAIDNAGNISDVTTGAGWIVDAEGPTAPADTHAILMLEGDPDETLWLYYFTEAVDNLSGVAEHQARVVRLSDSAVVINWTQISMNGSAFPMAFGRGISYRVDMRAQDLAGNYGAIASNTFTTHLCAPGNRTFDYTGADQTFTVPEECTTLNIKLWGAGGHGSLGGTGGYAGGTMTVTPGETLTIIAGQGGGFNQTNAYGGGGSGYFSGGGGRSAIRRAGVELITAGGGGGGAGTFAFDGSYLSAGGSGGGATGLSGLAVDFGNGFSCGAAGGGTQSAGGIGSIGTAPKMLSGTAGSQFQGGQGNQTGGSMSGGGGGGYYGGGGGCLDNDGTETLGSGGGGGSSYVGGTGVSATTIPGTTSTPGNHTDSDRGSAGINGDYGATHGRVYISW